MQDNIKNHTMLCLNKTCYLIPNIFLPTNICHLIQDTPYLDSLYLEFILPELIPACGHYFDNKLDKLKIIISSANLIEHDKEYQKYIKRFTHNKLRNPIFKKYNLQAYVWLENNYDSPIDWIGKILLNEQQENIYFLSNFSNNKQVEGLLHNTQHQFILQILFPEKYFSNWQQMIVTINNLVYGWQMQTNDFNIINKLIYS